MEKKWHFFRYKDGQKWRDSSSAKHFKEQELTRALVREFAQNSLDACKDEKQPVEICVSRKEILYRKIKPYIAGLKPHLNACKFPFPQVNKNMAFLVLEDFNTTGLERKKLKSFYEKDNITDKTSSQLGGSHGIGKIIFYEASKIKSFFGFSIFADKDRLKSHLRGTADLKSHKIEERAYMEDGALKELDDDDINFFKDELELFSRCNGNDQPGLSVAIPFPKVSKDDGEDDGLRKITKAFSEEFYYPISENKLAISIAGKKLNAGNIIDYNDDKIDLLMEYITKGKKDKNIKEKITASNKELTLKHKEKIIEKIKDGEPVFINFSIDIHYRDKIEDGQLTLLMRKIEKGGEEKRFDFWRGNLLINKAAKRNSASDKYLVIIIIDDEHLHGLLRKLEDPGHTTWVHKNFDDEVKDQYKHSKIADTVRAVTQLPHKIINLIKNQDITLDSNFFSDYFPDKRHKGAGKSPQKGAGGGNDESDVNPIHSHPNLLYSEDHENSGFSLALSEQGKQENLKTISITAAYGTNKGNAFNNYDPRDFDFSNRNQIKIDLKGGQQLSAKANKIICAVKNENFKISFSKFDPDRELKIEIKEEE